MTSEPVLLVTDDEPGMVRLIQRFGSTLGFRAESHGGGRETMPRLGGIRADVALVDLQMPDIGGLEVLRTIRARIPQCEIILMTARATIDKAIEAMKLGALDCSSKPLPFDRLKALHRRQLFDHCREPVRERVFGHTRGAFTGATANKPGLLEAADGGTLFLDEIGELPMSMQAKLLRPLESGEVHRVGSIEMRKVNVHVVAATNPNLMNGSRRRPFPFGSVLSPDTRAHSDEEPPRNDGAGADSSRPDGGCRQQERGRAQAGHQPPRALSRLEGYRARGA